MRVIADLHIHSKYSRATSKKMNIDEITRFAQIKGLNLLGTGDFTHPKWLEDLKRDLVEDSSASISRPAKNPKSPVRFMMTSEVSTIFPFGGRLKKIHHIILTPSFETAIQVNERLGLYGNLNADGRPLLNVTAPQLVEEVMEVSEENMVIPSHVWTPWFSIFGAFSGFNKVEDCYQEMTKFISALETGLSSDPPMNWRLSTLDRYTLISNSDSHSAWPWRIGREANVFDLKRMTYQDVINSIRSKDTQRFKFTIETDPAYGKYHWTGHRKCNISLAPQEAMKLRNLCPVCRRNLTKGVQQRVEELADRPLEYKPKEAVGYMHLLPLSEIISKVLGTTYLGTEKMWNLYNALINRFGNEYSVLIDAPFEEISKIVGMKIAEIIIAVREGKVTIIPGYDGVYGQLVYSEKEDKLLPKGPKQRSIADFT